MTKIIFGFDGLTAGEVSGAACTTTPMKPRITTSTINVDQEMRFYEASVIAAIFFSDYEDEASTTADAFSSQSASQNDWPRSM
jgi:hypothetical protein